VRASGIGLGNDAAREDMGPGMDTWAEEYLTHVHVIGVEGAVVLGIEELGISRLEERAGDFDGDLRSLNYTSHLLEGLVFLSVVLFPVTAHLPTYHSRFNVNPNIDDTRGRSYTALP
jgi:hypothetical protein